MGIRNDTVKQRIENINTTTNQLYLKRREKERGPPSHVNIQGNEIADVLAKAGADDASVPSAPLTYLELFSRAKSRNKTIWLIPPEHHWYQGSRPVHQLTAADATKQFLLASLVVISEV
ncbi:hypothetical protein AVEN_157830-1 [Araneus ventricosus]|uniref:RNase H type-1 domain-containing protein n=1 Tax=Araneus ventricosus TaxID=182803 RepID=A0A4Y2VFP6_ARAVE|nr:hypothetical protein AVEN_262536-1 [Araneus ventricosus]GBO22976.1 hypothetical protein AVEN_157830-1 [Araneus ventricosus]